MRRWTTGALLAVATAACATVDAVDEPGPPDEDLTVDAEVGGGMHHGGVESAEIHIAPDGDAAVTFEYWSWKSARGGDAVQATRHVLLDAADREELRASLERSGFFDWWPDGGNVADQDTWRVTVRSGDRTQSREMYAQKEFNETAKLLRRVIDQAVAEHALAAGRDDVLAELFDWDGSAGRVLHVESVVTRLRETALQGGTPEAVADAMKTLSRLLPADGFDPMLRTALSEGDAARHQAILAAFMDRGPTASPLRHRDVVLPEVLAAMERSGSEWGHASDAQTKFLRDCASALVVEHEVRAAPIFEKMVVDLSTDEKPLALAPLAGLGDAAIDSLVRLLEHERVGVRIAAAQMCEGLAFELTSKAEFSRPAGFDPSTTLAPFRERLVPKLERVADDAAADPRLRRAATEALAAVGAREAPPGWTPHRLEWN